MIDFEIDKSTKLIVSALGYTQYSRGRFKEIEENTRTEKVGAWSGCFQAAWDYHHKVNRNDCY